MLFSSNNSDGFLRYLFATSHLNQFLFTSLLYNVYNTIHKITACKKKSKKIPSDLSVLFFLIPLHLALAAGQFKDKK